MIRNPATSEADGCSFTLAFEDCCVQNTHPESEWEQWGQWAKHLQSTGENSTLDASHR